MKTIKLFYQEKVMREIQLKSQINNTKLRFKIGTQINFVRKKSKL